jgi:hypothetical protein
VDPLNKATAPAPAFRGPVSRRPAPPAPAGSVRMSPIGSSVAGGGGSITPPGIGVAFRRGRAALMKVFQISAGAPPPVTFFIEVLSSLPVHTAVTKPPV